MCLTALMVVLLTPDALAKRAAPAEVPKQVAGGVVFTAPHFTTGKDGESVHGGVVEAREEKSGKLLWSIRVYETRHDPGLEGDVQDVFIKTLSHDPVHGLLVMSDEKDRVFVLDLKSKKATRIR